MRYKEEDGPPARMIILEQENQQLIAKVSDLLDKLIESEQFIKDMSEKLEVAEKERAEGRLIDEQLCQQFLSNPQITKSLPLLPEKDIIYGSFETRPDNYEHYATQQPVPKVHPSINFSNPLPNIPVFNSIKSDLFDMVSEVREHHECSEGVKKRFDKFVKEMVVGSDRECDANYALQLVK